MRIVALSDTHTKHRFVNVPVGDVLLFAGDGEFRSARDLMEFDNWLAGLDFQLILVIAGNHDFYCERHPYEARSFLASAVYLQDESFTLPNGKKGTDSCVPVAEKTRGRRSLSPLDNGIRVWGSPMTPTFMNWAFMASESDLACHHWNQIPDDTDILLVHGPAFGHGDTVRPGAEHLGSASLAARIEELKIPWVIHGHIHGGYGIEKTSTTTYINCSVLDEDYQVANEPVVIDL